jgi:hypothetical protein
MQTGILSPLRFGRREKLILAGLYLSRFDSTGLANLGFGSFKEAFNIIAYAMGSRPATVKNYRDEFDPLWPNARKGWRNRPVREYCMKLAKEFECLDEQSFTDLIKSFFGDSSSPFGPEEEEPDGSSQFAKRLTTGLAAERYFESQWANLPEFDGYAVQKTTHLGCGYDYRLTTPEGSGFMAVEVKGIRDKAGSISLTQKEYDSAAELASRFFLFVVKNFQDKPFHEMYRDPLTSGLLFRKHEQMILNTSWQANV